jgi:hypothetical protein
LDAVVVVVVAFARGQQVLKVREPAVFPPLDVVQLAVVLPHGAAGDRAGGVQGTQGSALGPAGGPAGSPQVQLDRGLEHDPVADHDRVEVGLIGQVR